MCVPLPMVMELLHFVSDLTIEDKDSGVLPVDLWICTNSQNKELNINLVVTNGKIKTISQSKLDSNNNIKHRDFDLH